MDESIFYLGRAFLFLKVDAIVFEAGNFVTVSLANSLMLPSWAMNP
jgi:hypothetical protein